MMELALRNYIRAFKWQNVKDSYHNGGWFTLIYLLIVLPLIMALNYKENGVYVDIIMFLIIFPFVFSMFTSVLYPMRLAKHMYLCPMSREMRKDYIIKACIIRTLVPIFMTLVIVVSLLALGATDWISALGMFLNSAIFSVFFGSGTNMNGYGSIDEKGQRSIPMDSFFSLMEAVIVFFCLMICCGHGACSPVTVNPILKLLLIGATLVIALPATISYLKYWPSAVENALSYETSTAKPTKSKK